MSSDNTNSCVTRNKTKTHIQRF